MVAGPTPWQTSTVSDETEEKPKNADESTHQPDSGAPPAASPSAHAREQALASQLIDEGWDEFDPEVNSSPPAAPKAAEPSPIDAAVTESALAEATESPAADAAPRDRNVESESVETPRPSASVDRVSPTNLGDSASSKPANEGRRTHDVRAPRVSRSTKDSPRYQAPPTDRPRREDRPQRSPDQRSTGPRPQDRSADRPSVRSGEARSFEPQRGARSFEPRRAEPRSFEPRPSASTPERTLAAREDRRGGREDQRDDRGGDLPDPGVNRWRISRNASGMRPTSPDAERQGASETPVSRPQNGDRGRDRGERYPDRSGDRGRRGEPSVVKTRGADARPAERAQVAPVKPETSTVAKVAAPEIQLAEELKVIGAPRIKTKPAKKDKPRTAKEALRARAERQLRAKRPTKNDAPVEDREENEAREDDATEEEAAAAPIREKKKASKDRGRDRKVSRREDTPVPEPIEEKPKGMWQRIKSLFGAG